MNFQTFTNAFFPTAESRDWGDDYKVYDLTLSQVRALAPNLKTPLCQSELCEERVEGIAAAFKRRPQFFEHKTTCVVAVLVSLQEVFLMDGQHRMQFILECADLPPLTMIRIVAYNIRSEDEMRDLFQDLNHDSFKNKAYVSMGIDQQRVRDEVKASLHDKYHQWFPRTKKKNTRLQTLAAFCDALPVALFTKFTNCNDVVQYLVSQNHLFLKKLGSVELYTEERDVVQKGQIIFPLIYCNFVDFLENDEVDVYYEGPRHRKAISQKTRRLVWTNEFGPTATTAPCPMCKKSELFLEKPHGFECGHIISHKNKGDESPANLRPICAHCNQLMGTQNWVALDTKKKTWFSWR